MTFLHKNGYKEEVASLIKMMFATIDRAYDSSDYRKLSRKNKFDFINETLEALGLCSDISIIQDNNAYLNVKHHRGVTLKGSRNVFVNGTKPIEVQISTLLHELQHRKQKGFKVLKEHIGGGLLQRAITEGNAITTEFLPDKNEERQSEIRLDNEGKKSIVLPSLSDNGLNYTIYVKLSYLLGEAFMDKWQNDASYSVDYIEKAKECIIKKYGVEKGKKLGDDLFKAISSALINYEFLTNPDGTREMMGSYIGYALQTRDVSYCSNPVKDKLNEEILYLSMQMKNAKGLGLDENAIWERIEEDKMLVEDMNRAKNNSTERTKHLDEGLQVAQLTQTTDIVASIENLEKVFEECLRSDIEQASAASELSRIQNFIEFYQGISPRLRDDTTHQSSTYFDFDKVKALQAEKQASLRQNDTQSEKQEK